MTLLVGGVAELFQGDLDVGRRAVEQLQREGFGQQPGGTEVVLEELHYGAVAVAQRIEELQPSTLVLLGAVRRGRLVGSVCRRLVSAPRLTPAELQVAIGDAVTGYVGIDLVVEVASALGVLPARTVAIELEPESVAPGDRLTDSATRGLATMLALTRHEVLSS